MPIVYMLETIQCLERSMCVGRSAVEGVSCLCYVCPQFSLEEDTYGPTKGMNTLMRENRGWMGGRRRENYWIRIGCEFTGYIIIATQEDMSKAGIFV